MRALYSPQSHVLVAARDNPRRVIWVESNGENRQESEVAEGNCARLLPLENLDGEGAIHSNRDKQLSVVRKGEVEDTTSVLSL